MTATPEAPVFTAPQKVCRSCGAMAQTASKKCPNCGKKYKRRTALKVVLGLCLVGLAFIVGCAALIGSAATEVGKQLDAEQAAHAITKARFDSLKLGASEAAVIKKAGKEPENRQDFETTGVLSKEPENSSCIYYNRAGGSFGDSFQLCFANGKLESKNAY